MFPPNILTNLNSFYNIGMTNELFWENYFQWLAVFVIFASDYSLGMKDVAYFVDQGMASFSTSDYANVEQWTLFYGINSMSSMTAILMHVYVMWTVINYNSPLKDMFEDDDERNFFLQFELLSLLVCNTAFYKWGYAKANQ